MSKIRDAVTCQGWGIYYFYVSIGFPGDAWPLYCRHNQTPGERDARSMTLFRSYRAAVFVFVHGGRQSNLERNRIS